MKCYVLTKERLRLTQANLQLSLEVKIYDELEINKDAYVFQPYRNRVPPTDHYLVSQESCSRT